MYRQVKFSIKFKVISVILVLLITSISMYFLFAANLFKKDKEAYIFEQGLNNGKNLARRTNVFLQKGIKDLALISALKTDPNQKDLVNKIFELNKSLIGVFVKGKKGVKFKLLKNNLITRLNIDPGDLQAILVNPQLSLQVMKKKKRMLLKTSLGNEENSTLVLAVHDYINNEVIVGHLDYSSLKEEFFESAIYDNILVDQLGSPFIHSNADLVMNPTSKIDQTLYAGILSSTASTGTKKITALAGDTFLATFASVEDFGLRVISQIESKEAFKAITFLLQMSGLFAVFIIFAGVVCAIVGARQLTRPVQALMEGTEAVSTGNFTSEVKVNSHDELGVLSDSFNYMSGEIVKYMEEIKEKTRMEGELEVAHLVQDSFFPDSVYNKNKLQIFGNHQSASECGGDWWGVVENDEKVIVFMGDATGHGVPAALVTATTFCCVNVLRELAKTNTNLLNDPASILGMMNKAVYQMGGEILMTFFVGIIDLKDSTLTYSNASHNTPYILNTKGKNVSKDNINPVMDAVGLRLGQKRDTVYESAKSSFSSGDILLLFTDGIIEGANKEGKEYGERRFLKSLVNHHNKNAKQILEGIISDAEDFYEGVEVDDDLTLAVVKAD